MSAGIKVANEAFTRDGSRLGTLEGVFRVLTDHNSLEELDATPPIIQRDADSSNAMLKLFVMFPGRAGTSVVGR